MRVYSESKWYDAVMMNKKIIYSVGLGVVLLLVILCFVPADHQQQEAVSAIVDYKNTSYQIAGNTVTLTDGYYESAIIIVRYFGNELFTDLDGDGDQDIAFIVTQETGGSGTFYYAVAALNTPAGYVGSDGYLLGDRIAPQTTNLSPNPRHKYVVVFNYADRALNEPMTAQPSIGKSAYLKLVPETMQWAIVEPDFEGESAY